MPLLAPTPYWQTTDKRTVRLYLGDVIDVLRRLPPQSVQCVVTSPPYWGLRDYGTGTWEGGDEDCNHLIDSTSDKERLSVPVGGWTTRDVTRKAHFYCKCGAKRIDQQIGSESSPDCLGWARGENCAERDWATGCHVCRMVLVFREVRRVLRDDGTVWLNYGDSYASGTKGDNRTIEENLRSTGLNVAKNRARAHSQQGSGNSVKVETGLPSGNLVGVPWRVALALQADGWVLRQDIIWAKPSPMPESVRNRCTKSHEYVFLLAKRMGYFYDAEAVKEKAEYGRRGWMRDNKYLNNNAFDNSAVIPSGCDTSIKDDPEAGRNKRSVWTVAKPLAKLRDDLTPEQKAYVLSELVKRGLL